MEELHTNDKEIINFSQENIHKNDFTLKFTQPRGRIPKGMQWDSNFGIWVKKEQPLGPIYYPKPAGRTPVNKQWDHRVGMWVEKI